MVETPLQKNVCSHVLQPCLSSPGHRWHQREDWSRMEEDPGFGGAEVTEAETFLPQRTPSEGSRPSPSAELPPSPHRHQQPVLVWHPRFSLCSVSPASSPRGAGKQTLSYEQGRPGPRCSFLAQSQEKSRRSQALVSRFLGFCLPSLHLLSIC